MRNVRNIILSLIITEILILVLFSGILLINYPISTESQEVNTLKPIFIKPLLRSEISQFAEQFIKQYVKEYANRCMGSDFMLPLSKKCANQSGIGLMAVDSLDTVFLTGDTDTFEKMKRYIRDKFTCSINSYVSFHDLTTHIIGGLISAYALTGEKVFIERAVECGSLALNAFTGSVPNTLIHGRSGSSKGYFWTGDAPLNDVSGFLVEMTSLAELSGMSQFKKPIKPFLTCIQSLIERNKNIPVLLSGNCAVSPLNLGLSSLNSGFLSNLLRLHILKRSALTHDIVDRVVEVMTNRSFKQVMMTTNSSFPRFDASFCQLIPLLDDSQPVQLKLQKKLIGKCKSLNVNGRMCSSGQLLMEGIGVDDMSVSFDSGLLEHALRTGIQIVTPNITNLDSRIYGNDFMPLEAINRWAKLILLDGSTMLYQNYILNEAGHIIPRF